MRRVLEEGLRRGYMYDRRCQFSRDTRSQLPLLVKFEFTQQVQTRLLYSRTPIIQLASSYVEQSQIKTKQIHCKMYVLN